MTRPGRIGANCVPCEADIDAPDNTVGYAAVRDFIIDHAGHRPGGED